MSNILIAGKTTLLLTLKQDSAMVLRALVSGWFGQVHASAMASQMCKWVILYINMIGGGGRWRLARCLTFWMQQGCSWSMLGSWWINAVFNHLCPKCFYSFYYVYLFNKQTISIEQLLHPNHLCKTIGRGRVVLGCISLGNPGDSFAVS